MDVDADIAPVLASGDRLLEVIQRDLLPRLAALDEDVVESHYSMEEQARLYLSAAFTLAFSLYSLDKLNRRSVSSNVKLSDMESFNSVAGQMDPQLLLKIERITEYIKKLREITHLSKAQMEEEATRQPRGSTDDPEDGNCAKGGKRAREEVADTRPTASAEDGKDLGDAAMFGAVTRVPGDAGVLVARLLKQVNPSH